MEALHAVYPARAAQVAQAAAEQLAAAPKGIPYKQRMMLGLLSGVDPDGTLSGRAVAANQTAIHAASVKPSNAGAPSAGGAGADRLTIASRTSLQGADRSKEAGL